MSDTPSQETRRALPMQRRDAAFQPATYNAETRTIELVWSTGAAVRRTDFWSGRQYDEVLSLEQGAVDLTRLNTGAPLLDSHRQYSLDAVLGVVESAWIDNGEGRALVRFSQREEVAPVLRDVQDGVIRNVSVGYAVRKVEVDESGKVPVYRATEWQPMELSLVAVGADAAAGVRAAASTPTTDCTFDFITPRAAPAPTQESIMDDNTAAAQAAAQETAARAQAAAETAIAAERQRSAAILGLCMQHRRPDLAGKLIADNATVDQARAAVLDAMAAASAEGTRAGLPHVETLRDETETRRAAMENAILHRAAPGKVQLNDSGRQYRGMTLLELARDVIERAGISSRGMDKMQIAQRALSTSDFPAILANVANKTLQTGYESAPQTFKPFTRMTTASDFKSIDRVALGDAPRLKKVNESGEFTMGTVGEGKESYQLATYGRIISITRQALVNDDLSAFAEMPAKFGRAAADLESDIVWGILTANAALSDTVALFHASHGNLAATGAAISVATLAAARAAMRVQKGLDGNLINVSPSYLLVPAAQELVAQQYTSADFVSAKSSDINPFKGSLQVIAEPRLDAVSATAWYLAADPMQIDTVEYAYLEGNQGVYLETQNGFEVDGMQIKARLDFAAKAIDYRGLYRNPGA